MAPIAVDQISPLATLIQRKLTKQKKTKGGNLPKPVLIAIVVVVVVLLFLAIVLPIIQKRRKARREPDGDQATLYSAQDSSHGLYQRIRMSRMFGGPRTGDGQPFQGLAAHEKQRAMDGVAGHQGFYNNSYGSVGLGSGGQGTNGLYFVDGYPSPKRPGATYSSASPPARPPVPGYN